MLSIWWDITGPIYYELLKPGETINSEIYCHQLANLNKELSKKHPALFNRKKVILHHDNARPNVSLARQKKIMELGWEVLSHPSYSPDLAPSDYHLFLALQHFLNGKSFMKMEMLKQHCLSFLFPKTSL